MQPPNLPRDDGAGDLAAIDEILQVMYWLRGERLARSVAPADLSPWLDLVPGDLGRLLEQMEQSGWVQRDESEPGRFLLTEAGIREGGRRFADEFAELIRQGHGECNDPNCDCQQNGPDACTHSHDGAHRS